MSASAKAARTGRPLPPLAAAILLLCALSVLPACGSDDATGPGDDGSELAQLVGRWEATSMVLTSKNDETISVDIVQAEEFGGSFVLDVEEDGRYQATLTVFDVPKTERGSLEVSGNTLIFRPDAGEASTVRWSLSGDTLTLEGDSDFDFNGNGQDEPATLHLELVRS